MSLNYMEISKWAMETTLFCFGPVIAITSARQGQKQWIKCEILISMVMGLVFYIKPELFLTLVMNSPQKDYHYFLCMMYGFYIIYSILVPLKLLNSMDRSVFYGHHWSKVVLLCLFTGYHIVNLLINLYFLRIEDKAWARHPYSDRVDVIARIDSLLYFIAGVLVYAFPEKVMLDLSEKNETYTALCRSCAALILSLGFESYCLSEFLFLGDKKNFMQARVLGSLAKAFVIVHASLYWNIFSLKTFLLFFIANALYTLVVVYGYTVTPNHPKQQKLND